MKKKPPKTMPLTRIQQLIGRTMHQSKLHKPCSYMSIAADLTELAAQRKKFSKEIGCRISTNDFFYYALKEAALQFPKILATLDGNENCLQIADHVGIGFAVAAPQGLVVPVIQQCETRTLPQIAQEGNRLLKKARSNKLELDDFYGADIVVSGLGSYGIESFYAIAPPSAVCIIALGNLTDQCCYCGVNILHRKIMHVSMSVSNLVVDDFYAAGFLRNAVEKLERPEAIINKYRDAKRSS